MPTHAELAVRLLRDAAEFFISLGEQNPPLQDQMAENASVFRQMADILEQDPQGNLGDAASAALAGKLLMDAAVFFTTLAEQNEPIREQMLENAGVYRQIGDLVAQNPLGVLT